MTDSTTNTGEAGGNSTAHNGEAATGTDGAAAAAAAKPIPEEEDDDDLFGEKDEEDDKAGTSKNNASSPVKSPEKTTVDREEKLNEDSTSSLNIPKKVKPDTVKRDVASGPAPASSSTITSPTTLLRGSAFGLPDSVKIPNSVDTKLLEGGILAKLRALPPNLANDALQEYDDALQIKGNSIRNQGAYLYGVIKRYTSVHERATTGGEGTHILPMGEGLTPGVNAKLETLVSSGFCTRAEMNEKVKSKIRMLSEKDALFAIDELASTDRASIRNFGSFFMGILNRYMRGDTQSRHDTPSHPSSSRQNRFDRNSYGNNNRDRSRDRGSHQNRREHGQSRFQHHSSNQHHQTLTYDNRKQPPSWHQGSPPPPPPPPPPQHPAMGYNPKPPSNYPPPAPYQPQQQQPFVPQRGGYPPSMPPQQPPPNSYGQMPPNTPGYTPQQPMMGQQHQQGYNMGNQPPVGIQPPQQTFNSGPMGQMQQQQRPGSYGGWQQPPQPQQPPQGQGQMLDILALADKASSAVQALANQNPVSNQRGPYGQNHSFNAQQQSPYQPQSQYPPQQQQPSYGMPPTTQPQQHVYGSVQPRSANNRVRHTTATMEMLSPQVQYAVQNLIATGHVEKAPDEGILGMVYDLPEGLALATIQKFATIDKSSMRSRVAYLAGCLRRELERLNKR